MKTLARLALIAAAGALTTGAAALAQESDEFVFVVDRSEITGERTAQEVYAELVATAGAYCAQFGDARQACMEQMVELAVTEIGSETLTAVHYEVTAREDGVMTASYRE